MRYHPLDIDYDGWMRLDDSKRWEIGLKYLKRNRRYIEYHRGKSFWVMIGSKSGRTLARSDSGETEACYDFPDTKETERISRMHGEFGMVYTRPIKHDDD